MLIANLPPTIIGNLRAVAQIIREPPQRTLLLDDQRDDDGLSIQLLAEEAAQPSADHVVELFGQAAGPGLGQ